LVAALEDTRFKPISLQEVPLLIVEVSFLTDFEKCSDIWDWEMMKHGIEIEFLKSGENFRSTYLPHVAEHFKTKEEMMDSLIKKAGYRGNSQGVYSSV
jgi:AMMECR1 domain-containing protein